jgi:hypothetical protein
LEAYLDNIKIIDDGPSKQGVNKHKEEGNARIENDRRDGEAIRGKL